MISTIEPLKDIVSRITYDQTYNVGGNNNSDGKNNGENNSQNGNGNGSNMSTSRNFGCSARRRVAFYYMNMDRVETTKVHDMNHL